MTSGVIYPFNRNRNVGGNFYAKLSVLLTESIEIYLNNFLCTYWGSSRNFKNKFSFYEELLVIERIIIARIIIVKIMISECFK